MLETYGPPPYFVPRRGRGQTNSEYQIVRAVHIEKYFDRFMGSNELETLVNMYWVMVDEVYDIEEFYARSSQRDARRPGGAYKEWAARNSMNNKKLNEFRNTLRPVMATVSDHLHKRELLDEVVPPAPEEQAEVTRATIDLFKEAYSKNVFTATGDRRRQYTDERGNVYHHASKAYCLDQSLGQCVIAAQVIEIQDDPFRPPRRVIGLTVPIDAAPRSPL
jgi:hypothetical protein